MINGFWYIVVDSQRIQRYSQPSGSPPEPALWSHITILSKYLERRMLLNSCKERSIMSLTRFDPQDLFAIASASFERESLHVSTSIRIEAETRRVLYALATPEYMEAWLQFPGMDRIECHPDKRSVDRFRIDLSSCGSRRGSINAS